MTKKIGGARASSPFGCEEVEYSNGGDTVDIGDFRSTMSSLGCSADFETDPVAKAAVLSGALRM